MVIDHGAVAILVRLLISPYDEVREQVYIFVVINDRVLCYMVPKCLEPVVASAIE